jgi:hypothetical protein
LRDFLIDPRDFDHPNLDLLPVNGSIVWIHAEIFILNFKLFVAFLDYVLVGVHGCARRENYFFVTDTPLDCCDLGRHGRVNLVVCHEGIDDVALHIEERGEIVEVLDQAANRYFFWHQQNVDQNLELWLVVLDHVLD